MKAFEVAICRIMESNPVKRENGDYIGENGLLYCGKCHTPKQCEVKLGETVIRPAALCQCEIEKDRKQKEIKQAAEARQAVERNRQAGFHDSEMLNWTFENDDRKNPRVSDIARRYVDKFDELKAKNQGLILYGNTGTGKTFISACIANALIDKGHRCMMTNFPRLINIIGGMKEGKQDYIDSLNSYELLIIDDLAVERQTDYTAEIIQNIIDSRYRASLPLIVTTNLTAAELSHPTNKHQQRLYSRLYQMCFPLEVEGDDRRKAAMKDNARYLSEILGL